MFPGAIMLLDVFEATEARRAAHSPTSTSLQRLPVLGVRVEVLEVIAPEGNQRDPRVRVRPEGGTGELVTLAGRLRAA